MFLLPSAHGGGAKIRRRYTLEFKLKVIKMVDAERLSAADGAVKRVADHRGISNSVASKWFKDRERLEVAGQSMSKQQLQHAFEVPHNVRPRFPALEEELFQWFKAQRSKGLRVSADNIRRQALKIYHKSYASTGRSFSASFGWMQRFLARKGLGLRCRINVSPMTQDQAQEKVKRFINHLRILRCTAPAPSPDQRSSFMTEHEFKKYRLWNANEVFNVDQVGLFVCVCV